MYFLKVTHTAPGPVPRYRCLLITGLLYKGRAQQYVYRCRDVRPLAQQLIPSELGLGCQQAYIREQSPVTSAIRGFDNRLECAKSAPLYEKL
ncbi:hypothetical protein J6590_005044 [Homalodisca vitripennis]|nr:hypothetical protein J6590_005044 [Homalodisca vitripennis]